MNAGLSQSLVEALGWTLVHFLWQGAAIAALLAGGLRLLRRATPNHRYLAGCAGLLLLAGAPVVTFNYLLGQYPVEAMVVEHPVAAPRNLQTGPVSRPQVTFVSAVRRVTHGVSFSVRLEMILPWVVAAWAAGVLGLSLRLLAGWLQINRLQRAARAALDEMWQGRLAELAGRLGIGRPVRLWQSALVEVPTVIGWLRPMILLPASCLAGLTPGQLEAILAHELAHIRRHDYLVNLAQSVVETLLFYHPAVWWVSRQVREERENCCDDLAVEVCGDRIGYARALATLEELRQAPAQLALAAAGAPLLQRIRRLAGQSGRAANGTAWPVAGMLALVMALALVFALRGNRAIAAEGEPPHLVVTIEENGYLHLGTNATAVTLTELKSNLTAEVAKNPEVKLELRADKNAPFTRLREVTDAAQEAGIGSVSALVKTNASPAVPPDNVQARSPTTNGLIITIEENGNLHFGKNAATVTLEGLKSSLGAEVAKYPGLKLELHADVNARFTRLEEVMSAAKEAGITNIATLTTTDALSAPARANAQMRAGGGTSPFRRQALKQKLESIEIDSVSYDGLPLSEVINDLSKISRQRDPDGVGINFFIDKTLLEQDTRDATFARVTIKPALNHLRLLDVLEAVVLCSDRPIHYSVLDYGVMFSLGQQTDMELRTFHLDPNTFQQGLEGVQSINFGNTSGGGGASGGQSGSTVVPQVNVTSGVSGVTSANSAVAGGPSTGSAKPGPGSSGAPTADSFHNQQAMRQFLSSIGVDMNTNNRANDGKMFVWNDRKGILMVRANPKDLNAVEAAIQSFTDTSPPVPAQTNGVAAPGAPPSGESKNGQPLQFSYYNGTNWSNSYSANAPKQDLNIKSKFVEIDAKELGGAIQGLNAAPPPVRAETNGVAAPGGQLETRIFHVDPNTFWQQLQRVQGLKFDPQRIPEFLGSAGVDLDTNNAANAGKMFAWIDRRQGILSVRATPKELDLVEAAIQALNQAPPEINIRSKFIEITQDELLETRTFRVDPNTFRRRLNAVQGIALVPPVITTNYNQQMRQFLSSAGVDLDSTNATNAGKMFVWNDSQGTLMVRATPKELDSVETAMAALTAPKQELNFKVKFVEIDEAHHHTGLDWILKDVAGQFTTNVAEGTGPFTTVTQKGMAGTNTLPTITLPATTPTVTNSLITRVHGVLSAEQFKQVLHDLERTLDPDFSELTMPEVTTEDGHQAQCQAVDLTTIVTLDVSVNTYKTVAFPFGPTVDLVPKISADGKIDVWLDAEMTEFLGYEDPQHAGKFVDISNYHGVVPLKPLPRFRLRQMIDKMTVGDGETIVLGGRAAESTNIMKSKVTFLGDLPLVGGLFRSTSTTKTRKDLLVFITPTIINPDGTRVSKH